MERFINLSKEKYKLIGGALIALILFMGVMIYSSKAYANEEYWDIKIDGKTIAYVSSESEGEEVIDGVKNAYVVEGAKVESISLDKKLESTRHKFKNERSPKIESPEDVIKKILKGVKGEQKYTVKEGDTAWDIAYANNLSYDEFVEINKGDGFDPDTILPGDKIVISKMVPYVNVTTKQTFSAKEMVEPEVEYVEDSSMYKGEAKVKEEGKAGSKVVNYSQTSVNNAISDKTVLKEKVTKEATKTVVIKGTKERSDSASSATATVYGSGRGGSIASAARSLVGAHMDCVSLASSALARAGISFRGWPEQFLGLGSRVPGGVGAAQPGDILVYRYTNGANGGAHYDHVAVYVGGGMAVHGGWRGNSVVLASAYIGSGISVVRP